MRSFCSPIFLASSRIGLWAGRRNRNLQDFALGGRSIPWWAVLASIIAAETSAATFLGTPAEGFKTRGYFYGQLVIGTILARIVIAFTFIKPYYDYRVQSIYEFLTVRFGTKTKNMASGIFLFTRVLGMGARLYLGGAIMVVIWRYLFPSRAVNLNTYFWGIVFVTAGHDPLYRRRRDQSGRLDRSDSGRADVQLDRLRHRPSAATTSPAGSRRCANTSGGLDNVAFFQSGWDAQMPFGPALKGMLEEPYTLFAAFIGSTFLTMATHGTDQDMVQRMLTATDYRKSQLSLILSGLTDIPIVMAFLTVGILLWVYYQAIAPKVPRTTKFSRITSFTKCRSAFAA